MDWVGIGGAEQSCWEIVDFGQVFLLEQLDPCMEPSPSQRFHTEKCCQALGRGNVENAQGLGHQVSLALGQLSSRTETGLKGVLCPARAAKGILHPIRDLPDLQCNQPDVESGATCPSLTRALWDPWLEGLQRTSMDPGNSICAQHRHFWALIVVVTRAGCWNLFLQQSGDRQQIPEVGQWESGKAGARHLLVLAPRASKSHTGRCPGTT